MKSPILGGYAVARSVNAADNRIINLYPEATPEGGKSAGFLTRCPGYKQLISSIGDGPIRGLWQFGGFMYVVSGISLYKVDQNWNQTLLGSVSGSGPVSMSDNGQQLFVACNPRAYTYSAVSNTFAEVTDPDFPGAVTVGFINGYFVFNEPNSQKLWITSYQDGSSVDPLEFAYADANPDNLLSLVVNRNEIWLFGTTSTEVWYYSGNVQFPLDRIQGAFNEVGCAAAYSPAKLDNTIFWLGSDPRGNAMVYKASGYGAQRVSTHGIEKVMQSYAYVGDAIGYSYQQEGHTFYVLNFPQANATWCYDVATGEWHERGSWVNGAYQRHRSNCQVNFNNKIILGDFQYGKLFEFDLEYYQDDIGIQRWVRSWRALPPDQNNLNRTAHHSLQLDMETGTESYAVIYPAPPLPPSPQSPTEPATYLDGPVFDLYLKGAESVLTSPYTTVVKDDSDPAITWSSVIVDNVRYLGKWYLELELNDSLQNTFFGLTQIKPYYTIYENRHVGDFPTSYTYGLYCDEPGGTTHTWGTSPYNYIPSPIITPTTLPALQPGQRCMMAIDLPPGNFGQHYAKVWFGINGVWQGDPATGTGITLPTSILTGGSFGVMVSQLLATQSSTIYVNQDDFSYPIPSGFSAWGKLPTLDPNVQSPYVTLSGNNKTATANANGATGSVGSTYGRASGKHYFEIINTRGTIVDGKFYTPIGGLSQQVRNGIGLVPLLNAINTFCGNFPVLNSPTESPANIYNVGLIAIGGYPGVQVWGGKSLIANTGYSVVEGCVVGFAVDFDAGKWWFRLNGIWDGDPVTGVVTANTPRFTPNTALYPYVSVSETYGSGAQSSNTINYGESEFIYPAPSGFAPWSKSLQVSAVVPPPLPPAIPFVPASTNQLEIPTTFSPGNTHSKIVLSGGNLSATNSVTIGLWYGGMSNTYHTTGKRYFEFKQTTYGGVDSLAVGLVTSVSKISQPDYTYFGSSASAWSYNFNNGSNAYLLNSGSAINVGSPVTSNGAVIGIAIDFDAGKIWFSQNGTWVNVGAGVGNPATGANPSYTFTPNTALYAAASIINTTALVTANFGATSFAYTAPTGFSPWKTASKIPPVTLAHYYSNGAGVLSNGDMTYTWNMIGNQGCSYSSMSRDSGKYYFEVVNTIAGGYGGAIYDNWSFAGGLSIVRNFVNFGYIGDTSQSWGFSNSNLSGDQYSSQIRNGAITNISVPQIPQGGFLGVAVDFDEGKIWFCANGTWILSGNPVNGMNPVFTFTPNTALYAGVNQGSRFPFGACTVNFGETPFRGVVPTLFNAWGYYGALTAPPTGVTESVDPKIQLRWSDDGGHTWSNYHMRELGGYGEYWTRVIWRRLGMTTKLRDRVYEVSGADPVKITLTDAELILSGTNS